MAQMKKKRVGWVKKGDDKLPEYMGITGSQFLSIPKKTNQWLNGMLGMFLVFFFEGAEEEETFLQDLYKNWGEV